jgi:hypothetical protein
MYVAKPGDARGPRSAASPRLRGAGDRDRSRGRAAPADLFFIYFIYFIYSTPPLSACVV